MGASASTEFTPLELDAYESTTGLSPAEILTLHAKFTALGGERGHFLTKADFTGAAEAGKGRRKSNAGQVGADLKWAPQDKSGDGVRVPRKEVMEQPEFLLNPFAAQLCAAFTSDESGAGALSFEDYVDLYAALSPKASFDTKARAAFRMYDFDGDGFLSEGDLTTLLATLTQPPGADEPMLKEGEVRRLVSHVMAEGDVDGNKRLNYTEFERLARRLPDFSTRFRVFIS